MTYYTQTFKDQFLHSIRAISPHIFKQERQLMQSIKGRRLIVYACVICKIYKVPAETFYHMTYSTNHFVRTV